MRLKTCTERSGKLLLMYPFYVKSTSQPPVQNSVAPENYLEEIKLELASTVFRPQIDNISASERNATRALKRNSKINLKNLDKEHQRPSWVLHKK